MPIYEYYCPKCKQEFELMRPISEAGSQGTCPKCGTKADKLVSVFASKENYTIKVPRAGAFRGQTKPSAKQTKK